MSSTYDFATIYSSNGSIQQVNYALKAADNGDLSVGLTNKNGVVLLLVKPKTSKLYSQQQNKNIRKISENCYMSVSGIITDSNWLLSYVSRNIKEMESYYDRIVNYNKIIEITTEIISMFNRYNSLRPIGINLLCGSYDRNVFNLFHIDTTAKTRFYKAWAVGRGSERAKTELEKLEINNLNINEMIENVIKIAYKSHDPLKELEFDLEIAIISKETDYVFKHLNYEDYEGYVEMYKDLTVDN